MSHPYTDAYGYPLTAAQALRRLRSGKEMYTGECIGSAFRHNQALTIHETAAVAAADAKKQRVGETHEQV